jgi:hypothetical protein
MAFCPQSGSATAEIVTGYRRCVIFLSLTVTDASALRNRIELNPRRLDREEAYALVVPVSVPYAGAVPDGGLVRL